MTRVYILNQRVLTNFLTKLFQNYNFAFHADSGLSYTGDQATQSYLESWQTIKEWKINYLSVFIPLFFTRACQNSWLEKPWNISRLLPKNIVQSISFRWIFEWIIKKNLVKRKRRIGELNARQEYVVIEATSAQQVKKRKIVKKFTCTVRIVKYIVVTATRYDCQKSVSTVIYSKEINYKKKTWWFAPN